MTRIITGQPIYQKGRKPAKVPVFREASRGAECSLRIPGVCCHDTETTVGAHLRLPFLSGAAQKPDDLFIMDACHACHTYQEALGMKQVDEIGAREILYALTQTQMRRRASGLIILKGEAQ